MTNPALNPASDHAPVQPDTAVLPGYEVVTPDLTPPQPEFVPAPVPPAPKQSRTGVVVLAIVAVLLLGAAGAFGALYFVEKGDKAALTEQLENKDGELTTLKQKVTDAEAVSAKAVEDKVKAENSAKTMEACREASRAVRDAGMAQDQEAVMKSLFEMMAKC
ncbi:hypothetical protein [Lentzea sp. NBRC 102530]|uniref:hypothetical protein n=1 Tax=Lentzea sp. NBRC 102530 TaxID=3032201 RepID=UPI0024A15B8A|nr:hypothetical protein [Lentzea sp. NBRC 102530]GLY49624.1 hypothetical protein Lesp01_32800 [Lentzea sp. NBRC 102530]